MKSEVKTAIIFGIGIAVTIGAISVFLSTLDAVNEPIDVSNDEIFVQKIDKSKFNMAPDIVGIAHYLNTTPEELAKEIEGNVVLYDIWTYSCINCVRTLPYITAWDDKYSDQGLLVIGIHSPEFEFEKDVSNVEMAMAKHGITYPVVMDNDWETWKAFENRYWPRKYIADHEGYIRYDHIGEGAYQETEKIIQKLLEERATALGMQIASAELVDIEEFEHTSFRTPELYFGYKFAQNRNQLGSEEGFSPEQVVHYDDVSELRLHYFYPIGNWKNLQGSMMLDSESGSIKLLYHAKEVNIVTENEGDLEIFMDGIPLPSEYIGNDIQFENNIKVTKPGLYNIISSDTASTHELEIKINNPGFQIFTFTFG